MSGIAGILRLDGAPVDERDVALLSSATAPLGPDRVGRWDGDGVALVHSLLTATPEAVGEVQPVVEQSSGLSVVFDGRLDNRDELLQAISAAGDLRRPSPLTDAEMVSRAYEVWGPALVSRLLGDFAFALWDARRRRLLCARDALGIRPLLYRVVGRRLAWASSIKPLATLCDAPTRPNPGRVAEYLASSLTSRHDTVYEGVYRLPPAHTLTAERGLVRLARYWDLDPSREVRHASHAEYGEHLLEVLTAAVGARTRTIGPVVAELSGGLDSSTVLGIAQTQVERSSAGAGDVRPVSLVYPGEACDESRWIDAVAEYWGLEPFKLTPRPAGSFDFFEASRRTGDVPDLPAFPHWGGLYAQATAMGARSVLNGIGGDECFTGTAWEAADLLRAGRIGASVARSRSAADSSGISTMASLWRHALRPSLGKLLPASVPGRLRAHRAVRAAQWIPPGFARSVGLEERLQVTTPTGLRTLSQVQIWYSLNSGELVAGTEASAAFLGGHHLEARMPFLDRRVVELAFSVPESERCGTDGPKRLLRTAAVGLVPDQVIARRDTPGPTHLIVQEALAPGMAPYLRFPKAAAAGWVDPQCLRSIHAKLAAWHPDGTASWHLWPLWRALAVELWLEATFPE